MSAFTARLRRDWDHKAPRILLVTLVCWPAAFFMGGFGLLLGWGLTRNLGWGIVTGCVLAGGFLAYWLVMCVALAREKLE